VIFSESLGVSLSSLAMTCKAALQIAHLSGSSVRSVSEVQLRPVGRAKSTRPVPLPHRPIDAARQGKAQVRAVNEVALGR
jgi:hypothetical protein